MTTDPAGGRATRAAPRIYYGWVVVAVTFCAILVSSGIRASPAALIHPLEQEFGWDRASVAFAAALGLLFYGIAAPICGRLLDQYGPRRIMLLCLGLTCLGVTATAHIQSLWQLNLFWGVTVGFGTGGMVGALSATVATRWFSDKRGLVMGLLTAASSSGQAAVMPMTMGFIVLFGWRAALLILASVMAFVVLPAVLRLVKDGPEELGLPGNAKATVAAPAPASTAATPEPAPAASLETTMSMLRVIRTTPFWLIAVSYVICGATDSGLIGTHLLPYAIDRGIPEVSAAVAVGVMGVMNLLGTTFAGWCSDRFNRQMIVAVVFCTRAVSLFMLPFVSDLPGLLVFSVLYGVSWIATGPPVASLVADIYGRRSIGSVYGWIMLVHQLGSASSAYLSGVVRTVTGDYAIAFIAAAVLALVAATLSLQVRMLDGSMGTPVRAKPSPAAV